MAETRYNIRLAYVPVEDVSDPPGTDPPDVDDPKAPPGSTDPRDDPRTEELNGDWLRLEQAPFAEAPAGGFAKWLQDQEKELTLANYAEYFDTYGSKCGDNGDLEVTINVHKSRPALAYKIIASFGALSQASRSESTEQKSISVQAGEEIDLQAYVKLGAIAEWEGPVYNEDGEQMDESPKITQAGQKLSWKGKATGTIRTEFTQGFDTYTLTITPRAAGDYDPKDRGTAYQSTVMCFWGNGNVEQLDVSLPDMTGNCSDNDDDDPKDPKYDGDCYDLYIKYHKCTGEEISRSLKSVQCPEVVKADCEKRCNELPHSEIDPCLENCK